MGRLSAMAKLWHRDEGQTMAEYAMVLCVISIAIILVIGTLSGAIEGGFQRTSDLLDLYLPG